MKTILFFLFLISQFLITQPVLSNDLYQIFQNPPAEARPFMRWWWNGNCVEAGEILRELDIMKAAGIGGIEINPIAMPATATKTDNACYEWGSPEWSRLVKVALDGARNRGMISDIIIGTGWPFGGRFLEPDEQIQGIVINTIKTAGPRTLRFNLRDSVQINRRGIIFSPDPADNPPEPELKFVRLAPLSIQNLSQVRDITSSVENGWDLSLDIPEGEFIIFLGTLHRGTGFRMVTNGAPGADGPCLDHYNQTAVLKYLNRLADRLEPVIGAKLGKDIRALFVDSIELSGANWTKDILSQFRDQCGYDLDPYLPFVIYQDAYSGYQDNFILENSFADEIKRARFDFNNLLANLFLERFTQTYHEWCNQQQTKSRYQAYGMPWLVGMAEGYMIPDIPESNNWLFSPDAYGHGYNVWNKYTAAGGHLTGRSIISCEAMTNTRGVFNTTLNQIKCADDLNFIMGINHSVLHGFNYSPPAAGFPGWVRYGAYFSEQNPWWPYFRLWADYNARLSAVFQTSQPVVDIAILNPKADIWSTSGLYRSPFQLNPWYCHRLWEPLSNLGSSADYISEKVLQEATFNNGKIQYGPMNYKVLILADVQTIFTQTAQAIQQFAGAGGKIIFIGKKPTRSPSLLNSTENDRRVSRIINSMIQNYPERVILETAPEEGTNLLEWTSQLVKKINLTPAIKIDHPKPEVYQIYQKYENKDIFFLINNHQEESVQLDAIFPTGDKTAWRWDPETGQRAVFPYRQSKNHLKIRLDPYQSILLVFEPGDSTRPQEQPVYKQQNLFEFKHPWAVEFQPVGGDPFRKTLNVLMDLSQAQDQKLKQFAGKILYETDFEVNNQKNLFLDLGAVYGISEVILNGNSLGVKWYGKHVYGLDSHLREGKNQLKIKVTTVLLNYVKSLEGNPTAQSWTRNQTPTSTGLLGPVKLFSAK
jgi:hypothetical protein